jgi:phosphoesterase RecJ-like protein
MSSPQTQTTSDLQAVADALRSHDRFLLVTHENPDGDALGSLLATKLALDSAGQGQRDVPLRRRAAAAGVRLHAARDGAREPPHDAASGARRARLRERAADGPGPRRCSRQAPLTLDIDHHHDNSRFGDVNLVVGDASSTGEVLRDVFARARRRS